MLILLGAALLRTMSLYTWDGGTGQHPDERFFARVTAQIRLPASASAYFDAAHSPANPRNMGEPFFVYGTLPPLLTRLVAVTLTPPDALPERVAEVTPFAEHSEANPTLLNPERDMPRAPGFVRALLNPNGDNLTGEYAISRVGRSLVVLFDLGSIVMTFLIARRLFDRWVALLAALLSALTVMHIQQAHFYVDSPFSTFFVMLALYWAVRVAQGGRWYDYAALGGSIGLAMGNRATLVLLFGVALVAALVAACSWHNQRPTLNGDTFLTRGLPLLLLVGFAAFATFRVIQPYAFTGSTPTSQRIPGHKDSAVDVLQGWGALDLRREPRFFYNMRYVQQQASGQVDFPPSLQWVNRPAYLFPLKNMVLWGMGPALGVAVWGGWAALGWWLYRLWRGQHHADTALLARRAAALVVWVWAGGYFAWQGSQFTMTLRYMLPISGALIIAGAWGLLTLARAAGPRWLRVGGQVALVGVVLLSGAWAYAFTRIYTRPHPRVTAARWMIQHAAPTDTSTYERWDDHLPLYGDYYNPLGDDFQAAEIHPYALDTPQKYTGVQDEAGSVPGLLDRLEQANYITLSSNRAYAAITRLPARYPAMTRYYRALFDGSLGFRLVADITSYPSLLGFEIPDQSAEEAFSVYDHPRVLIFRKTAAFSRERAYATITNGVNWNEVYHLPVATADRAPDALMLTQSAWPAYRAAGTWADRFGGALVNRAAPLLWLALLYAMGAAAFALLFPVLRGLPDGGWALARIAGVVLVAYGAWALASLHMLPFSAGSVWVWVVALVGAGAGVAWRWRGDLRWFWRERWRVVLAGEGVFLAVLLVVLVGQSLRAAGGPPGGIAALAALNAVLKSAAFPPYDPWFAGGYLNQPYFGLVVLGVLALPAHTLPQTTLSLAPAFMAALAAVGAWGVVVNLLSTARGILVGAIAGAAAGVPGLLVMVGVWPGVPPDCLLLLPLLVTLVGVALALRRDGQPAGGRLVLLLLAGVLVGAVYATHPPGSLLAVGALGSVLLVLLIGRAQAQQRRWLSVGRVGALVLVVGAVVLVGRLLFLPFHQHVVGDGAIALAQGETSALSDIAADDRAAIAWLQHNVAGTPILVEAHAAGGGVAGRVAAYTGLPTLLAQRAYQAQQRRVTMQTTVWAASGRDVATRPPSVLARRAHLVALLYNDPEPAHGLQLIQQYGVAYVVVGHNERALYAPAGLQKFDTLAHQGALQVAFRQGDTTVYRVLQPGTPSMLLDDAPVTPPTLDSIPPLRLKQAVNELPAVRGFAWNTWANGSSWRALLVWVVALYGLLLLGLPLALALFSRWRAGGFVWARLIGLLILGYAVWLPTSLGAWRFDWVGIAGGLLLVLLLNAAVIAWVGRTPGGGALPALSLTRGVRLLWVRLWQSRRHILISEIIFLVGLGGFAIIRAYNPDLWHPFWGGEKPMEFAFFNAILRSPVMPPYSPFFSDGYINYYYYGLYLVSLPTRITGIAPAIAFNLIIPTLFAQTLAGSYAIVAQLTGRARDGLVGAVLVALAGNTASAVAAGWSRGLRPVTTYLFNPDSPWSFWERVQNLGAALGDWYIGPSRVVTEPAFTINEFPFWSFLFADLHPHLIALPITLLVIALLYQVCAGRLTLLLALFIAFALGTLAVSNSWDFPTYALLTGLVMVGRVWRSARRERPAPLVLLLRMGWAALLAVVLAGGGLLLYTPFFDYYHAMVSGVGFVRDGMRVYDYVLLHGLFVALLLPLLGGAAWRFAGGRPARRIARPLSRGTADEPTNPAPPQTSNPSGGPALPSPPPTPSPPTEATPAGRALIVSPLLAVLLHSGYQLVRHLAALVRRSGRAGALVPALVQGAFLALLWPAVAALRGRVPPVSRPSSAEASPAPRATTTATDSGPEAPAPRDIAPALRGVLVAGAVVLLLITPAQPVDALLLWLVALIGLGIAVLVPRHTAPATWFILLLATMAWAVSLGIEIFYIRDHLEERMWYRMNTVFKFGMQIWTLLALATAAGLPLLLRGVARLGRAAARWAFDAGGNPSAQRVGALVAQGVGGIALLPLLLAAAVFPLVGVPSRIADRFAASPGPTLDGLAFLQHAEFVHNGVYVDLRPDADAIAWLNDNIVGTPIIAQSNLGYYREYGVRVAANTGLPTIVSSLHENEQRDPALVAQRDRDVDMFWRTTDAQAALHVLRKYRVNYIYVGSVEHAFYPPQGIAKFQTTLAPFLEVVYATPGVQIYAVTVNPHPYPRPEPFRSDQGYTPSLPDMPHDGDVPQDVAAMERALLANPTNAPMAFELAQRYRAMHRLEDAARILETAAAANPTDIGIHHLWGDVFAEMGRYDEAERIYTYAANTSGKSFDWVKLGAELLQWGELDKAEVALLRAVTTEPVDPVAHYHLGLLYNYRGDTERAIHHLQRYLESAPEGGRRGAAVVGGALSAAKRKADRKR